MAKAKKGTRRAWTAGDKRQMKTMAKAKLGVTKDRESFKADAGCYHRDGRQARRIPVDARLDLRTFRQVHTNTNCRKVTGRRAARTATIAPPQDGVGTLQRRTALLLLP